MLRSPGIWWRRSFRGLFVAPRGRGVVDERVPDDCVDSADRTRVRSVFEDAVGGELELAVFCGGLYGTRST